MVSARRLRARADSKAAHFPLQETTASSVTSPSKASPFRQAKEEKNKDKTSFTPPSPLTEPLSSRQDSSFFPSGLSSLFPSLVGDTATVSPRSVPTGLSFSAVDAFGMPLALLNSGVPGILSVTDGLNTLGDVSALLRSRGGLPAPDFPALAQMALTSVGLSSPSPSSSVSSSKSSRAQQASVSSASSGAEPEGLLDGNGNSLLDNVLGGGGRGNLLGGMNGNSNGLLGGVSGNLLGNAVGGNLLGGNAGGNLLGGGGVGSLLGGGGGLLGNDNRGDRYDRPDYSNSGNGNRPIGNSGLFGNKQKCCSDCRKGDMDCLADCQRGNCSQSAT
ncbi:hypothetical protein NCLIV_061150 [Neospora caninum Liverpool]|nr:hypothetical protein NCLIV_061150 [Neospora caninum Liverpool]CBZ55691.1 hypothetical protein NCLIV_061150 [Neospora caninum Liverpool]|eukprot:XP_003885717.1 hypothetical protein NCLIV_061150 [Neospora caninum Liverpool]